MPERGELLLDGALLHLLCDKLGGAALDAAEGPTAVRPTLAAEAGEPGRRGLTLALLPGGEDPSCGAGGP
jgi:hypothetical protein